MKNTGFLASGCCVAAVLLYNACVKPPDYPLEPVIEYVSMSKNQMIQGKQQEDSLTIYFNYTDGDGDLGYPKPDNRPSVFIKDGRDSFVRFQYALPYVEPQGTGNGISGMISIVVPTACCIYTTQQGATLTCNDVPVPLDTLHYLITIKDRAGHTSNEIQTGPIKLICH